METNWTFAAGFVSLIQFSTSLPYSRSLSDLGSPSENLTERGQILSILKVNSSSIDQESGEI
jgi:hypothetical protein